MNIFRLIILSSFFSVLIFSCTQKENNNDITDQKKKDLINSGSNRFILNDSINTLLKDALQKGDTISYNKAYHYFAIYHYKREFLYYSITMADKYHYGKAYFDTHYFLKFLNHENGLDTNTGLINYYLLKAYEAGNKNAKKTIKDEYLDKGSKIPKSISFLESK